MVEEQEEQEQKKKEQASARSRKHSKGKEMREIARPVIRKAVQAMNKGGTGVLCWEEMWSFIRSKGPLRSLIPEDKALQVGGSTTPTWSFPSALCLVVFPFACWDGLWSGKADCTLLDGGFAHQI